MGIDGVQERVCLPAKGRCGRLQEEQSDEPQKRVVTQERDELSHERLALLLVGGCRGEVTTRHVTVGGIC